MKRRDFLKRSAQAALVMAAPVVMMVPRETSAGQLWGQSTTGLVGPDITKKDIETWIRECLKKNAAEAMDNACYYGFGELPPVKFRNLYGNQ